MSLLARFDDAECRAWFSALIAICAIPHPPSPRDDPSWFGVDETEAVAMGMARTLGAAPDRED